jgi:hypothetical protein
MSVFHCRNRWPTETTTSELFTLVIYHNDTWNFSVRPTSESWCTGL